MVQFISKSEINAHRKAQQPIPAIYSAVNLLFALFREY